MFVGASRLLSDANPYFVFNLIFTVLLYTLFEFFIIINLPLPSFVKVQ